MKKLTSTQAKQLLKSLNEEEMQYIADINNTLYNQNKVRNLSPDSSEEATLSDIVFISKIFGYVDKFKMFHWSAENHAMHEQIDDFYKEIEEFKDDLAENVQGIFGQFNPDTITKIDLPSCEDPITCINNLKDTVLAYMEQANVADSTEYEGVRNICSGFMETVYKYIYLFRLCK